MKLNRTARVAYLRQPSLRSTLVSIVAMTAILFGFLVLNSAHAGHETTATHKSSRHIKSLCRGINNMINGLKRKTIKTQNSIEKKCISISPAWRNSRS